MTPISLLVPTRQRPEKLAAMWESALDLAASPDDLELIARADDDDPSEYPDLPGSVTMLRLPRALMSQNWNDACAESSGDILWHGGDDNLFRTQGWDEMVREAHARYPDGIAQVHGRDGHQDEKLATHGFITRQWVQASGWFVPPYFASDYNDTWLTDVADTIGRRVFLADLFIEHMHPAAGKAPWDATHTERLARHYATNPGGLYEHKAPERAEHAARLQAAIDTAAPAKGAVAGKAAGVTGE